MGKLKEFNKELGELQTYFGKENVFQNVPEAIKKLGNLVENYKGAFEGRTTEGIKYNNVYLLYESLLETTNEKIAEKLERILDQ